MWQLHTKKIDLEGQLMWQLHTKKIDLEGQLMWQLRNKNKIFSKTEIQLSSTIGQGNTLFSTHSTLLSLSLSL